VDSLLCLLSQGISRSVLPANAQHVC
jgi:hypothetical protein